MHRPRTEPSGAVLTNPGPLDNMQASRYWSGTEYAPDPNDASLFGTFIGLQSNGKKGLQVYGWAVRPGQVAAAPLPGTALLMALGSLGFGAGRWVRRRLWSFGPSGHSVLSRGVRGGRLPPARAQRE